MKKALITGISGFAGSHLAEHLLEQGFEVSGTHLSEVNSNNLPSKDNLDLHQVDLLDEEKTFKLIEDVKPDYIFHLAAMASPKQSFNDPKSTFTNNIAGQINILEAVKKFDLLSTKILVISSAEVYGRVSKEDLPMDEETAFRPTNPYAVSKLAQDYLGLEYFLTDKLQIVRVRPFNHVGPRQSPDFVISAFAKRIVGIEKGNEKIMKVGNLASRRDFTDVRDMVKAYLLALEKGEVGEVYNLGSGKSYEISQILEMMISKSKVKIEIEQDQFLTFRSDDPELLCDSSKFESLTGWRPQVPIEKTLEDTLDYWRNQL